MWDQALKPIFKNFFTHPKNLVGENLKFCQQPSILSVFTLQTTDINIYGLLGKETNKTRCKQSKKTKRI